MGEAVLGKSQAVVRRRADMVRGKCGRKDRVVAGEGEVREERRRLVRRSEEVSDKAVLTLKVEGPGHSAQSGSL